MKKTKKITGTELRQLIKEEVARAQKIKSLKEEKTRIEKILSEMEEGGEMDEYAEIQPSDVPGHTEAPVDLGAAEKELASVVKIDPSVIEKIAQDSSIMQEGMMDAVKSIFSKKDEIKKEAPGIAASAGIKSTQDFMDKQKLAKFVGNITQKLGWASMTGGAGAMGLAAIISAMEGSAAKAVEMGLPEATASLLLGGIVVGIAGTYLKYAAGKKSQAK